jgi:hypothetical protein
MSLICHRIWKIFESLFACYQRGIHQTILSYMRGLLFILLISAQALAATRVQKFSCTLSKLPKDTFTFRVKDIGAPNAQLINLSIGRGPVYTSSRNKGIHRIVETLQGATLRKRKAGIQVLGEQIGCDYVWLNLNKKTGYTKGTLKADFQCSDTPIFKDQVSCTIKQI